MLPNVPLMGGLGFNHLVISKANDHKTHGNFPLVQKRYIKL
jgi:hypothetical protein